MDEPSVSVITICEAWNKFIEESLCYYIYLDYTNFNIYVFSTEPILPDIARNELINYITSRQFRRNSTDTFNESLDVEILIERLNKLLKKVIFINNHALIKNAPLKRDMAIEHANGEYFAFIDDDAYPSKGWLKAATANFIDDNTAAIAGPGITPINATLLEKTSGYVSASPLGGFGSTYRFMPQKKKIVDDFPSMNLIVKSSDFKKIDGFDSNYYPGEDTKLCMDITYKLNKKIIYEPNAYIYHHIRPLFKLYLIQNSRYGLHRGHFAKIFPKTSRRWFYFIPAIFAIGLTFGHFISILTFFTNNTFILRLFYLYVIPITLYYLLLTLNAIWVFSKSKNIFIGLLSIPGTFASHFYYGINFIKGFLKSEMKDDYGRTEN